MNNLDELDFAKLSEEEMKILKQAEDLINEKSEEESVYLMALKN